jgi:hypothetical protein
MKVKMFAVSWDVDLYNLEDEVNTFLATLSPDTVKHVQSATAATRTGPDTDQGGRPNISSRFGMRAERRGLGHSCASA